MIEPRDDDDNVSHRYGPAHATRHSGETHWRVSFARDFKGTVHEVGGRFHATYRGHGVDTDLGDCPTLDDAIEALMDED